jgi:hypothetical protein
MATEQEELRLTVTLADNASAGLEKLQAQIKELGGGGGGGAGGNKHIEKLNEGTKALTETVMKMTGSFGEAFKSLGMLRLGFIGGVAGLAAFGYEMAKQIKDLGEYTDKLRGLGQLGKDIGLDPGAIKNISEQLKVFGVSAEQSEASLAKFAQRMAELQRDPRVRLGILQQTATDPRAQADMNARIDALNRAATIEDKLNIARQMYENIRQNALRRGETEERAADEARQGMLKFGYDTELSRAGVLRQRTEEERKADKERFENATAYSNLLGKIGGQWEHILELIKDPLFAKDSLLVKSLERFSQALEKVTGAFEAQNKRTAEHPSAQPQGLQRFNPFAYGERFKLLQEEYGKMTGHGSSSFKERWDALPQKLDEHKKSTEENTEATKKLSELIQLQTNIQLTSMQGGPGGGGGIMNAAYTTGGGFGGGGLGGRGVTPRGFGGGGYRDLGTTYGGGGKPYGSHVGPGTGAGAGQDTSAGPVGTGAFDRSRFAEEMRQDPELAARMQTIVQGEVGHKASRERQLVQLETIFNRAAARGQTLRQVTMGTAEGRGGYYPPSTFAGGRISSQAEYDAFQKNIMGPVLAGSDESTRLLGFPATGNASAGVAARGSVPGGRYTRHSDPRDRRFGGETYVQEGRWGRGMRVHEDIARLEASRVPPAAPDVASQPPTRSLGGTITMDDIGGGRFGDVGGMTPEQLRAFGERRLMHQSGDLTRENLLAHARRSLDADQNGATKVEGNAKIRVDVNAPKGTNVGAEASGLFSTIETYRQTQMAAAQRGPPRWGPTQ